MTQRNKKRNDRIMRLHATKEFTWQGIADRLVQDGFERVTRQNVGRVIKMELARKS